VVSDAPPSLTTGLSFCPNPSQLLEVLSMSDAANVRAALHALDHNSPINVDDRARVSNGLARVIGSRWYTGQEPDSYAFVSTGAIPQDVVSFWRTLVPSYLSLGGFDRRALDFLAGYLLRNAGRGPVPGWSQVWVPPAADSEAS
jgi:hypothetical protein